MSIKRFSVDDSGWAEAFEWQRANDRHVIERDEARAKLARIEALCDERSVDPSDPRIMGRIWPSEIRAIFAGGDQ